MDWRGGFVHYHPAFQDGEIITLKTSSTNVLVKTLKLAYDSFYKNVFMESANANKHKELAMVFLDGLFCYLRGVEKLANNSSSRAVLPHFIANPILNALLESALSQDDLIYLFCAQANLSLTQLSISPQFKIQPVIFQALKQFNIQTIDVSNCNFVEHITIWNLAQSESIQQSLVSLKIRGCNNVKFLPDLSKLKSLETLDISEIYDLELAGYQYNSLLHKLCIILYQLPLLKNFTTSSNGFLDIVSDHPHIRSWSRSVLLESKVEYLDVSVCPSVYQLCFNCSAIEDFLSLIVLQPNLHSLDLSGWYLTEQTFFNVFSHRKAFKFLGLLNIPALISSQNFSHNVTYFAETVTSLSTHNQIINSLTAYLEKPQFLEMILQGIQSFFVKNDFLVNDKALLESYLEALIKILNYYYFKSQKDQLFPIRDPIENVISCLWLFTSNFTGMFTRDLSTLLMKNCFVFYKSTSYHMKNEKITENLVSIISTLITPEALKSEELYPFYFAMITFTLYLLKSCTNIIYSRRFIGQTRVFFRMENQHLEFLNMLTIELPRKYLAWIGINHQGIAIIAKHIHAALYPMSGMGQMGQMGALGVTGAMGVHLFENLWGVLRNLVYLCPDNCNEYLKYAASILHIGYHHARKKQWQEVINLIHQGLENVIECWLLDLIAIDDIPVLNCIEDFLLNKINYFVFNDYQYTCSFSSIIIYLGRMFERSKKILPEYLQLGLELVLENLPRCNLVCRVERRCLRALIDCTRSTEPTITRSARWLIENYLEQDFEHYSKLVPVNEQDTQPEVIIID